MGSGHEQAAKAVKEELLARGVEVEDLDFMDPKISLPTYLMKLIYLSLLKYVPHLYEFMYQFTQNPSQTGFIQRLMSLVMTRSMKQILKKTKADLVLLTHPFPADALSRLDDSYRANLHTATLITDYSLHAMWVAKNIETYFVAHEGLVKPLISQGILPKERIYITGMPVHREFSENYDQAELRRSLDIGRENKVILLMGGGLGIGGIRKSLYALENIALPLDIIVIAGKNKGLFEEVENFQARSKQRIILIGYTNEIAKYMKISDLLITKPGGITLSEAYNLGLPMLLHNEIPGPELENARFMEKKGIAKWLHTSEPIADAVEELLTTPNKLDEMRANGERTKAAEKVAELVLLLGKE